MISEDWAQESARDDVPRMETTRVESVSAIGAWRALEPLLHRLGEFDAASAAAMAFHKISPEAPLIAIGNEISARAVLFGGLIELPMCLRIVDVQAGHCLRVSVGLLGRHFADIDFTVEEVDHDHTRLSCCQRFYPEQGIAELGEYGDFAPRAVPESAAIFDRWRDLCLLH